MKLDLRVNAHKARAEEVIKAYRVWAKSKGYRVERKLQSALFHLEAYEGDKGWRFDTRHATLDGWHGSGKGNRNYGNTFMVHSLYWGRDGIISTSDIVNDFAGWIRNESYFKDEAAAQRYLDGLKAIEEKLKTL